MSVLLIILLVVLLCGSGAYYVGPLRPEAGPNNIIGVVVFILIVVLLLRLLGVY